MLRTHWPDILHSGYSGVLLKHTKQRCYHNFLLAQPLHVVLCAVTGEKGFARVALARRVHTRPGLGCSPTAVTTVFFIRGSLMKEAQSNAGNQGHHSGPQSHGDQQKGNVNDTRPGHQTNPGQPGKPGQQESDRREPQKFGKPDTNRGGRGPEVPGHGAESPLMSQNRKSGGDEGYEDEDEREEAAEKEPFIERQLSHPGTDQGSRDSGRVAGNHSSYNPAQGNRPSGN